MVAIPGYTILRQLGRGGMAVVYLARQESLDREVALKVLAPSQAGDGTASERFLREARIAASLHHPHIVPIHDFGVHEGSAYIAMDYEPGGTVAPLAGERLEPRAALRILRDVASALAYAHGRGVVHRDIKPDNILRRSDGAATLSDFGIARLIQGDSVLTTEGTSVGTPHYMSPEQLRGDKLDGRSDLYSLGVVFWQLLTGELPFVGTDSWAIGTQHLTADIPRLPPALAHLQPLLESMLAKKPEARVQSGEELVHRIDALLATSSTPAAATAAAPSQIGRRRRDQPAWRIGRFALLAVLVLALSWLGWRQFGRAPVVVATTPAPATESIGTSLAVLPLEDLSQAHDQAYFSDGMADELQTRLAQVPGLQVAGRTSSQSFQGRKATVAEIGKALSVANVLEGSVRKDGQRLRITMQLSNVASGFQVWTQSYDRKLTDVFAVQEDIASAVVEALKLKLLEAGQGSGGPRYQPRFEVYDQYLRGRQGLARNDLDSFRLALAAFRKAVELDPKYPDGWSGLAMAESFVSSADPDAGARQAGQDRAMAAAERAVSLDPQLGDALAARGYLRGLAWQWSGALADVEQAVRLDPRDGRNQLRLGYLLATLGRLPQAQAALDTGTRVDPLMTPLWYWLGRIEAAQGHYVEAARAFNRAYAIDPNFRASTGYLAYLDLLAGRPADARRKFDEAHDDLGVALSDYSLGKQQQARAMVDRHFAAHPHEDDYRQACSYAWTGQADRAFEVLDGIVAAHDGVAIRIPYEPLLRDLHGDPRFAALLSRMGLPPQ